MNTYLISGSLITMGTLGTQPNRCTVAQPITGVESAQQINTLNGILTHAQSVSAQGLSERLAQQNWINKK